MDIKHYYWNKTAFESLAEFERVVRLETKFAFYADYLSFRQKGLRKQALKAIQDFLAHSQSFDVPTRHQFVSLLFNAKQRLSDSYWFIPQPLSDELIKPVLEEWMQSEPHVAELHLWYGTYFCRGHQQRMYFEKVIALEPNHQLALRELIWLDTDNVDDNCHHLGESSYLGDPQEDLLALGKANARVPLILDKKLQDELRKEIADLTTLIRTWIEYQSLKDKQTFPEYCTKMKREYRFRKAYYYDK